MLMCLFGGPGTGKSTVIKGINKVVVAHFNGDRRSVLRLGTTGTAAFEISGITCHSALKLPINRPYHKLSGNRLRELQTQFSYVRVIIIDEVSMMGQKMIRFIDRRLRELSGKANEPFGGYWVILVGDFQQLPPVGDKALYDVDGSDSFLLFDSISDVVELTTTERQSGNDTEQQSFKRVLSNCQKGLLDEQDWCILKQRFIQTAEDTTHICWDNAPHLFFDNRSSFEYNMGKLKSLGTPIARIKATHNCYRASKRDSTEAGGLQAELYLACGAEVMLTSNLWTDVGLHNGARGKVVDIVYKTSTGPGPLGTVIPNAVVVQFEHLNEEVVPFLNDFPRSIAIPIAEYEWRHNSDVYTRKQFPLMLSWAYTIHKSQGKTLDKVVIDLGTTERCSGMTLVALSRVRKLRHLLLRPFSYERLKKINKAKQLQSIQNAINRLQHKFQQTKLRYPNLWRQ